MDLWRLETAVGPVELRGRDTGRPVMFCVPGLYATPSFGAGMQPSWPGVDLVVARVPGDGAPELVSASIGVYAAAYSEALAARFPGRRVFGYGVSTGALIVLGLRQLDIGGMFLAEPPLRTGDLWPLRDALRDVGPPGWERIVWPTLGLDRTRHEPRDYTPLLDVLACPAIVVVGGEPLMPRRPLDDLPSLVDEASRALLRRHPSVELIEIGAAGHAVLKHAEAVEPLLRRGCANALGSEAARPS